MVLGTIGRAIRDSITGTIAGAGDVLEGTANAARLATVTTLQGSRDIIGGVQGLTVDREQDNQGGQS